MAEHGLLPVRQIDDRQPPVGQPHAGFRMESAGVRPAVELGPIHGTEHTAIRFAPLLQIEDAGNPAHVSQPPIAGWPRNAPVTRRKPPGRPPRFAAR